MKNTKTVVSPFGWGEICGRDFEAIVYGAVDDIVKKVSEFEIID